MVGLVLAGLIQLNGTVLNVSAVETQQNIGVYWDQKCTQPVTSINWGTLTPGQTKTVTFYVKNTGNSTVRLVLSTANYSPLNATSYIYLATNANNTRADVNVTIKVTPTLTVSSKIKGITGFSFSLAISGQTPILGDINFDGKVDISDAIIFGKIWGTKKGNPSYNPYADLNKDGVIDIFDAVTLGNVYTGNL